MASLRGRVVSRVPSNLQATGGLAVSKENGRWTFRPDFSQLGISVSVSDAENEQFWLYNAATDSYSRMTVQALIDEVPQGPPGSTGATGPGFAATSASSVTIASSGSKAFTTQAGLAYSPGARVRVSDVANPTTKWMEGVVTAYSGTTLTFTADKSGGSGTLTSWNINIAGQPGATGASGAGSGDLVSTNNLSDVDDVAIARANLGISELTEPPYVVPNVSGSGAETTGTITSASTSLSIASESDFANGDGIRINHAGASFAINDVTSLSVSPQGTTGATSYAYTVATLNSAGGVGKSVTNATISNGNASLTSTNFNRITWVTPTGTAPAAYAVYGREAGSLVLLAIIPFGVNFFDDIGGAALTAPDWLPTAPQTSASLSDWLITIIASGAGTTSLVLSDAAGTSATSQFVTHDDTEALQDAIDEAMTSGKELYLPTGSHRVTSPLTVTSRLAVRGTGYQGDSGEQYVGGSLSYNSAANITQASGWKGSAIVCDPLKGCFDIDTNDSLLFEKFQIVYPVRAMSGVIAIDADAEAGAGNSNTASIFRDLFISGPDTAIWLTNFLNFRVEGCTLAPWTYSIRTEVPNYPSFGDSVITNNVMYGRHIQYHVFITSGGGLRVCNNKIVSGTIGIYVLTTLTGDQIEPLVISDNSIEGQNVGIDISRNSGSDTECSQVTIVGNQLFVGDIGVLFQYTTGVWINGFSVVGNHITVYSTTGVCAQFDGCSIGIVSGNSFSNGMADGAGVVLGSHSSYVNVQSNIYYSGLATDVTNAGSNNTIGGGST